MRRWVDPPRGWVYGFPKVYDEEKDGPSIQAWLIKQGYPEDEEIAYLRTWPAEESAPQHESPDEG